jgi:hypothetical protein
VTTTGAISGFLLSPRGAVTTLIVGAPRPAPVNQEKPLSKGKTFETLEKLLAEASSEADVDGFYESASDSEVSPHTQKLNLSIISPTCLISQTVVSPPSFRWPLASTTTATIASTSRSPLLLKRKDQIPRLRRVGSLLAT